MPSVSSTGAAHSPDTLVARLFDDRSTSGDVIFLAPRRQPEIASSNDEQMNFLAQTVLPSGVLSQSEMINVFADAANLGGVASYAGVDQSQRLSSFSCAFRHVNPILRIKTVRGDRFTVAFGDTSNDGDDAKKRNAVGTETVHADGNVAARGEGVGATHETRSSHSATAAARKNAQEGREKVDNLKRKVASMTGIALENIILCKYKGAKHVPLAKDDQSLSEFDVKANDKLLLVSLLHLRFENKVVDSSLKFHSNKEVHQSESSGGLFRFSLSLMEVCTVGEMKDAVLELLNSVHHPRMVSQDLELEFDGRTLPSEKKLFELDLRNGDAITFRRKKPVFVLKKENVAAGVESQGSTLKVECSSHWNNWLAKYAFINLPHGSIPGAWHSELRNRADFRPQWVCIEFPEAKTIGKFSFKGRPVPFEDDSDVSLWQAADGPISYAFQGCNLRAGASSAGQDWETLFMTEDNKMFGDANDVRSHVILSPKSFRAYRLVVTRVPGRQVSRLPSKNDVVAVVVRDLKLFEAELYSQEPCSRDF